MENLWNPKPQIDMGPNPLLQAVKQRSFQPIRNAFSVKRIGQALTNQSNDPMSFMGVAGRVKPVMSGEPLARKSFAEISKMTPAMKMAGVKRLMEVNDFRASAQKYAQQMAEHTQRLKDESIMRSRELARQAFQRRTQEAFNRAHAGFDITKLFK